jgi:hypothetical protein
VHGQSTVPIMVENGKINPLSSYINTQRKHYVQCQIRKDRMLKLEAIDFIWKLACASESTTMGCCFPQTNKILRGERAHIREEGQWHGTLALDQEDELETEAWHPVT